MNSIADEVGWDNGVTTLRDAINFANADTGEDLIVFERSLFTTAQTITLNLGELDITQNVSIIEPKDSLTGGNLVTVSGNDASRVFEIEAGATVNFSGFIVESGKVTLCSQTVQLLMQVTQQMLDTDPTTDQRGFPRVSGGTADIGTFEFS